MVTKFINSALTDVEYLSSGLDSLADAGVVTGAAINNSSNRYMGMKVQIELATVDLSAQSSPGVVIRLIESIDGGDSYEDNDDKAYGITLPIGETSAAHKRIGDFIIPPGYFKLAIVNNTGLSLASTGNVLSYATYTPETDI